MILRKSVRAAGARGAAVDDLVQDLFVFLLLPAAGGDPRIARYSGRGPLASWLRITGTRFARKRLHRQSPCSSGEPVPDLLGSDPQLAIMRRLSRPQFEDALQSIIAKLSDSDRLLLRRYFLCNDTLTQLGEQLHVAPSTIARRIAAIRVRILEQLKGRVTTQSDVTDSSFRSLVGLLRSNLELDLAGALSPSGAA
ncbi:MAG: hypothetical protein AB7O24_22225 [Kofleriaceae bacterium]